MKKLYWYQSQPKRAISVMDRKRSRFSELNLVADNFKPDWQKEIC